MLRCLLLAAALAACAPSAPVVTPRVPDEAGAPARLVLTAEVRVQNDTLFAVGTITNHSGRTVAFDYGACDVHVRGWLSEHGARRPDIESRGAGPPENGLGIGCVLVGYWSRLRPGESTEVGDLTIPIRYLLRDDDPDGAYDLDVVLEYNEASPESGGLRGERGPTREIMTRVGVYDLDARRPPLGAETVRGGTRYTVGDLRADGGRLRATVTAQEEPFRSSLLAGFDSCAVTVLAFARVVDRDDAPRAASPVATWDAACGQSPPEPTIPAGPDRPEPFYGQVAGPVTVSVDVPLSDLLADQPQGRYAFALAVRPLASFGRLFAAPRMYLAASEVDWAGR